MLKTRHINRIQIMPMINKFTEFPIHKILRWAIVNKLIYTPETYDERFEHQPQIICIKNLRVRLSV